jgi:hypothetical protein
VDDAEEGRPMDHQHTAERIADVPWLAASRRAHENWPARLALLGTGCAVLAASLEAAPSGAATVALVLLGTLLATTGLTMGAAYGRVVGALVAALQVGYRPHWLAARLELHEGDPTSLAAELEQFAERQPAH